MITELASAKPYSNSDFRENLGEGRDCIGRDKFKVVNLKLLDSR